jgi:WD40 repeat protein
LQSFTLGSPEGSRWNEFPGSNRYGRGIAFSPDGSRIAAGVSLDTPLGAMIMMWDTSNGKQVLNIKIRGEGDRSTGRYPGRDGWEFGFTPDGHQLRFKSLGQPLKILDARPVPEATR